MDVKLSTLSSLIKEIEQEPNAEVYLSALHDVKKLLIIPWILELQNMGSIGIVEIDGYMFNSPSVLPCLGIYLLYLIKT